MSTILVTGGTGFVGGRITRKLAAAHTVIVSSRKPLAADMIQQHGAASAVLHNQLLQKESFPGGIDTVIHMAALNEWDCVKYPSEAIRVNIDETRIVLENAIAAGVKRFIYFSTAHIYGSPLKGVITEETLPVPAHPYAITHKAAEDYVVAAGLQKKIQAIVIRLSNSFGAPVVPTVNRWTLLANDLARQAIEKGTMTLLSNGRQYRDFVCLADVENAIARMAIQESSGIDIIYNLGAGRSMKVIDMAGLAKSCCRKLFNRDIAIALPPGAAPTEEPMLNYATKRLLDTGVTIENNFTAEMENLLMFCRNHFNPL